jgi:CheY-like chemotaxis protein
MRILHVEDDEDTRKLVECILQSKGWQVVSVENATSAFKLAAMGEFDLYLIDNWIEGDTENALCRGLRSLDPHTPILFYSGAVFPSDVASALASGAQGYLAKPCTPEALITEILKWSRAAAADPTVRVDDEKLSYISSE